MIDLSDLKQPRVVQKHKTPGYATGVHVTGSHALVANRTRGVRDVLDPWTFSTWTFSNGGIDMICVTGAGGTVGSELIRRLHSANASFQAPGIDHYDVDGLHVSRPEESHHELHGTPAAEIAMIRARMGW